MRPIPRCWPPWPATQRFRLSSAFEVTEAQFQSQQKRVDDFQISVRDASKKFAVASLLAVDFHWRSVTKASTRLRIRGSQLQDSSPHSTKCFS